MAGKPFTTYAPIKFLDIQKHMNFDSYGEKWTAWLIFQDLMCVRRQMRSEGVGEKEAARRLPLVQMAHLGRGLVY